MEKEKLEKELQKKIELLKALQNREDQVKREIQIIYQKLNSKK